jgi:hypothetical protein
MVWTGFFWLGIGSVEGCCEHGNELFGFHKMMGYSSVAAQLLVSQERLSFMKSVIYLSVCLSVCLSIFLSIYLSNLSTAICWTLPAFSGFLSFAQSVGFLGRGISPSPGRYLHTGQHKHRISSHNKSMSQVEFEATTLVFECVKTVHALDHSTTLMANLVFYGCEFSNRSRR